MRFSRYPSVRRLDAQSIRSAMKTFSLLVLIVSLASPASGRAIDRTPGEGLVVDASPRFHVALSYPQGGESFPAGTMIRIEWEQVQAHLGTNWDVFYSTDGGQIFRAIEYDLPAETRSYEWVVPNMATNAAQVRIVQDNDAVDYTATSPDFTILATSTDTESASELPAVAALLPGYPNPFSETTTLGFSLDRPSHVRLEVFDTTGRRVAVVAERTYTAGIHRVTWNTENVPPGTYIARIRAGNQSASISLVRTR
jgi:hypothetical protein